MIDSFKGKYAFLSNFYPCAIEHEGRIWKTAEHAFQAAKTQLPIIKDAIQKALTPYEAKRLGRTRMTLLVDNWDLIKVGVMTDILHLKFQIPKLKQLLLDTGDEELVEGNNWNDGFWGKCNGAGLNHLGRSLMKVRQEIRNAQTPT